MAARSAVAAGDDDIASLRARLPHPVPQLLTMAREMPSVRPRAIGVLAVVGLQTGLSTGICAEVLRIPKPSVTRHASALEEHGLLTVNSNPQDLRLTFYTITEKGRDFLRTLTNGETP